MGTTQWGDDLIERGIEAPGSSSVIYYPGQMMCLDTSGYAVSAADTAEYKFDGINAESVSIEAFAGDAAGARVMKVQRPYAFEMAIASAALGDEGKAVYVVDNQTVGYISAVSNFVFAGWVDQVISSTFVRVRPWWVGARGYLDREPLSLVSASGALSPNAPMSYVITKSSGAAALTLAAPTAGTDDGLKIVLTSATAQAHTLTATGLLNTGGSAVNVATFAAHAGASLTLVAYNGSWNVLSQNGVTFS
jgi:hypothetical protein